MSKVLLLEVLLVLGLPRALAQNDSPSPATIVGGLATEIADAVPPAVRDSLDPVRPFWIPIVEVTGLNTLVDCFNRYGTNSSFARISFTTVRNNFKHGFDYDADQFATNQWAHPFNGSLFFHFARSAGHDYWSSAATAMIGSWEWEYFAENEPPAINDWIQTSISGALIGEMFYRISSLIIDESATGPERFWREAAAFVIAPSRGFNRLIYGGIRRTTPYQLYEQGPVVASLYFGGDNISPDIKFRNGSRNLAAGLELNYGLRLGKSSYKPFEFFRMNLGLNFGFKQAHGFFYGYGVLVGRELGDNVMIGAFQHFDYLNNPVYTLGATAVGVGTVFRTPDRTFFGSAHVSGILMGATNSVYAKQFEIACLDSCREYNFGAGSQIRLEGNLQFDIVRLSMGYHFYFLRTIQGAPGSEILGLLRPKILIDLWGPFSLGVEYGMYHRHGRYHGLFPDIDLRSNELKSYVAYSFGS